MSTLIRTLVSQHRVRTRDLGLDLDLSYITPRVIAMGFPAGGVGTATAVESLYRNSAADVRKYLEAKHGNKYKVRNNLTHAT